MNNQKDKLEDLKKKIDSTLSNQNQINVKPVSVTLLLLKAMKQ